ILDAKVAEPKPNPQLVMLDDAPVRSDIIKLDADLLKKFTGDYEFIGNYIAQISEIDGNLLIDSPGAGAFTLLPVGETEFIMEDIEAPVSFKLDDKGKPLCLTIEFAPEEIYCGVSVESGSSGRNELDSLTHKLDSLTPQLMKELKVPGVSISVIADGQIAWSKGYGVKQADRPEPVTSATVFETCSMSKVAFTYVVLKLVEQGKLDLDRPLVEYLDEPYLGDQPLHKLITARMVVTHQTGFPNWREGGWRSDNPLPVNFTPGTQYGYSGEGFLYLQRVVEHITGQPLNDMMQQMLLKPIGMTSSSYTWESMYDELASAGHDPEGNVKPNRRLYDQANSAFSLYCTPDDYARFILEVIKEDRSTPYSLNQKSIAEMLTPSIEIDGSHGVQIPRVLQSQCDTVHRGLGWVVGVKKDGGIRAWHSGSNGTGFRCHSEFDPQTGNGIVIMTGSVNGVTLYRQLLSAVDFP
ncbi:MAG: beta-lactamase family protein, partial [Planctomycetes bacterium]|nr:beta-lactamase family protein [Planctomycetota bacterium]